MDALAVLLALALLYWWSRDRAREHAAVVQARQDGCSHRPEAQRTLRVSNIITMNAALIHRVVPGRRYVTKHCDDCGMQTHRYRPTLQPFDEFMREFDQETIDRAVELQARTQAHINEQEAKRAKQVAP